MAILAEIVRNHQAPWLSGDFGENVDFGEKKIGKKCKFGTNRENSPEGWQYPECGKYSNWMPKVAPSNWIPKEVSQLL